MDTELIATSAVKSSIAQTDILSAYISERDKEPSWDGHIYIHKDKRKKKDGIKKVAVQVKGEECSDFSRNEISFPISIIDLNNYLYNGGVIYFVVYIRNNGTETKIYYIALQPIKIKHYISHAKGRNSKSIKLTEFPSDNMEKVSIFLNFYEHSLKQASFVGGNLPSLDELAERNILEGITTSVSSYGFDSDDPKKALFNSDVFFYAKIKGSSILQPLELIPIKLQTSEVVSNNVSVNGELFYTDYTVIRSKETNVLKIGQSLIVEMPTDGSAFKIEYKLSGTINNRITDMSFWSSLIQAKAFEISPSSFQIAFNEDDFKNFDVAEHEKSLAFFIKIQEVLDLLGVTEELNIDLMNNSSWREMQFLITAFIEKKPVSGLKKDLNSYLILEIANLSLFLAYIKTEQEGTYLIYDFFKTKFDIYLSDEQGKMHPISQYSVLSKENYRSISNINFDVIISSFKETELSELCLNKINWCLLFMLGAYDEKMNDQLLAAAEDLADWFLETDDNIIPHEIKMLNKLQIVKRKRKFTVDEFKALSEITESGQASEEVLIGAYLLFGNQNVATIHFEKLEKQTQDNFKQYPIYKFWNADTL